MAITYVSGSAAHNYNYNTTTNSVTVDVGSGSDRMIVAFIQFRTPSTPTISSVTYNGTALTVATSVANNGTLYSVVYYLLNPDSGSNTLTVTTSAQYSQCVLAGAGFNGVAQTSALDSTNTATGSSTTPSVSVTPTEDDALVVAGIIHEANNALTVGSGETSLYDGDHGAWVTSASYAIQTTAAAQACDWTANQSVAWSASAACFLAAADTNVAPTIALNTADDTEFTTGTPALAFTGSDTDGDDLTYEIEISTNSDFDLVHGENKTDYLETGSGLTVHPDPIPASSQIDDRPGQSFTGHGGVLKKAHFYFGDFASYDQDGDSYLRVYTHSGTFGTSSAPANAADPADTPTTGELAISDNHPINDAAANYWAEHTFSGTDQIRLVEDTYYMIIADWVPDVYQVDDTFGIIGTTTAGDHAGNAYIDGASVANNGVQATWNMHFRVYEDHVMLQKASNTDSGFSGTPDNTDPYTAGQQVTYTVQSGDTLVDATYHWRVRVKDPSGSDTWSSWSTPRTFTVAISSGTTYQGTVTDGIELSEAVARRADFSTTITGGIEFSESVARRADFSTTVTDGINFSEANTNIATLLATATDGIDLSETVVAGLLIQALSSDQVVLSEVLTGTIALIGVAQEGLTLSEAIATTMFSQGVATDGLEMSDASLVSVSYVANASDGVTFSETSSSLASYLASVLDELLLSETLFSSASYDAVASDAFTLGETLAISSLLIALAEDGIVLSELLSGDLPGLLDGLITEGITFGDFAATQTQWLVDVVDGFSLGDIPLGDILATSLEGVVLDAITMGDAGDVSATFQVTVSDQATMADTIATLMSFGVVVTEGFTIGDTAVHLLPTGELSVTFSTRNTKVTFNTKTAEVTFVAKTPKVTTTSLN